MKPNTTHSEVGVQELTFSLERKRAVTSGILETAGTTFLLLIAVQAFHADAISKALLATGSSLGFLASPLILAIVQRRGLPTARAAAYLSAVGAFSFFAIAAVPYLPLFVVLSLIGMACSTASIPLITQVYQENYRPTVRGRLFSQMTIVRILAASTFSAIAGYVLTGAIERFPWLLFSYGLAFAFATLWLWQCPSTPVKRSEDEDFFGGFRFIRTDRLFRTTLVAWMLMGFGNLMMVPLRVEYLANPRYGLTLSAFEVALLLSVVPNIARVVMSGIWGRLFDKLSFIGIRLAANFGFMLGTLSFFCSETTTGLLIGACIFGVANAGGEIIWNLWITKFAPAERVASYMSVHVFLTGVRGVIAPMVAFRLLDSLPLLTLAIFSALLIATASIVLLYEALVYRHPQLQFANRS